MKKKLMTMVIAAGAMLGAWADLAGSGTKADPYRIGSYGDLVAFAAKVNGGEATAWAVLTADITATAVDWMPIGSYEAENRLHQVEYKGVFDGQGHTIANLSNAGFTDEKRGRGGLFYSLGSGGIVKNVQLTNVNVSSSNSVGAVVDNCKPDSTVENCEVSGSVSGNSIVGGVVGYALSDSVVRNCRVVCTVTSGASGPSGEIGGIVGITYGTIEDCEAKCTLSNGDHIGGIAGCMSGGATVTNCEVQCTVQGRQAGGIVGYCGDSGSTVADCRSFGTVKGGDSAGGIIGYCYCVTVHVCRASCDVTSTATGNYDYPYIGGIVARMDYGCVANCEAAGTLTGTSKAYAGGIIGYASKCPLEKCSSSCTVSGGYNVGGIVGRGHKSPIRNCYNTGSVTATVSDEYTTAGGIVGYNTYSVVENCYNTGAVSGTTSKTGGIVGENYGDSDNEEDAAKVLHSCALAGIAGGKLVGENYSLSVVTDVRALSAAEFRVQSNFTGWDFDEVWKMGENAPKLRTNYDVTYDENWAGGGTTTKELFKGDGILANAPADPKREGWYFCGWFTESEGGAKVTGETVVKGDATYYAQWGKPVATFAAGAVSSSESKTVKLTVYGGSLTGPSSVKVFMTYQTAAAADLDFANATINGVKVKGGLKFPLMLSWDTADVTPYTIEIPLKGDKTVEDDETVTFQLADVVGTEMGETDVCTVTVEDPAFDELRGRIETGTATKAESNSWIKVSHDGIPYFCGLADPADGGKATGSGYCPANKKVTLKASASKGFAFAGWTTNEERSASAPYPEGYFVATTPSLVIDRTTKPAKDTKTSTTISNLTESTTFYAVFEGDARVTATPVEFTEDGGVVASAGGKVTGAGRYAPGKKVTLKATANKNFVFGGWFATDGSEPISQAASFSFEMGEEDIDLYARFVTSDADAGSIVATFNGAAMPSPSDGSPAITTNVWAGVYLEWPLTSEALSQTTVKVSGLPSGLKFTAKDIVDSKTKLVTVPANTIYGAPTAASKAGKDGKPTPSKVKVTVTTAGKSSATYEIALTVDALPAWAVGSFDGGAVGGGFIETALPSGTVALTIATSGKISGKILEGGRTWSLSAAYFERVEVLESLEQLDFPDNIVFHATVIAKAGKLLATNEIAVAAVDGIGVLAGTFELSNSQTFELSSYQNLWKRVDTKAAQPVFKKNIVVEHSFGAPGDKNNTVKFTFKKDGAVSFSGKIGGVSVSGSAQLVLVGRDDPIAPLYQMTIYVPPKPTAKPPFAGWCETFPVKLTMDEQSIVTAVEIGEEPEMVQLWEGGPFWATRNIGAEKPEDSGYYFWWGDIIGYKWENEQWVASDGSVSGFSFEESNGPTSNKDVATLQSEGWITSDGVLAPAHDAAHVQWGGDWRMPTYQELYDLCNDKCDWTWTTMNGMEGYIVCGKGAYASNSIFLPCAGLGDGTSLYTLFSTGSYGLYWSSAPYPDNYSAKRLDFGPSYHNNMSYNGRDCGFSIRPVQSPAE